MNRADAPNSTLPDFFSQQVSGARRFYLNLKPKPDRPLIVVSGGKEQTTSDYHIQRSTFPFYSIEYVLRGQGRLKLKGRRHALQPGRVFSYGPGVPHEISSEASDPMLKYFVDFTGTQARSLLTSCDLPAGTVSQVFLPGALQNLFDEIIASGLNETRYRAPLCEQLLRCLALKLSHSRAPVGAAGQVAFSTYQQCRAHIEAHFRTLKNLDQVSRDCGIDKAYLCRLFARYDHQSPYQFLLRLKMNEAAEQLQLPGALVKRVAGQSGFDDVFHFSRSFKRVLGVSPNEFRRLRFERP